MICCPDMRWVHCAPLATDHLLCYSGGVVRVMFSVIKLIFLTNYELVHSNCLTKRSIFRIKSI